MEGRDVDLLLGLDMLKAHQACIDLAKNVLRIQDREVGFLSEHELPDKARNTELTPEQEALIASGSPSGLNPSSTSPSSFPGGGHTLGAAPAPMAGAERPAAVSPPAAGRYPEEHIRMLMDLGATREFAISTLDAAGGNVEMAASMLF
jgi:DNA damage-inducible protein 1